MKSNCLAAAFRAVGSFGLLCGLLAMPIEYARADQPRKPNVVFIFADDLGTHDLGCTGSSFYETPHLDRLAAEGMLLRQAYAACPVCSPTRAALMTGRYPPRTGITDFIPGNRSGRLKPPEYSHRLALTEFTVARAFKESGYVTGCIGKWHLGEKGFLPVDHGFDVGIPPDTQRGWRNDVDRGDRLTEPALKFLDDNRNKPFFLYLPHNLVHTPLTTKSALAEKYQRKVSKLPARTDVERFREQGLRQDRRIQDHVIYAAMMEDLDTQVGRVLSRLDDLGLRENTVVVFTSDNGGLSTSEGAPTSNAPLRAGKGWLYEGGLRVPAIVRFPGATPAGSVSDVQTITNDWFPTLLELCGMAPRPEAHLDGVSIASVLRGGKEPAQRPLFWHYPHYGNQGGSPGGAVRMGDFKLIDSFEYERVELYNLRDDPGEDRDLSRTMPEKARELIHLLREWRIAVGARMPTVNTGKNG